MGRDGYIAFDIGREDGHNAINDINSEPIEDWAKFTDVVDDIVENKSTDYPELQVVVIDTYDELCLLAEKEVCRLSTLKTGKTCDSINAAFGGYGRGQDMVTEIILDKLWELKRVGVCFILVAHVKRTNVDDLVGKTSTPSSPLLLHSVTSTPLRPSWTSSASPISTARL